MSYEGDRIDGMNELWLPVWLSYAVSEQLSAQYGAVKMLHSRVRLLLDYLKSIQSGKTRLNLVQGR